MLVLVCLYVCVSVYMCVHLCMCVLICVCVCCELQSVINYATNHNNPHKPSNPLRVCLRVAVTVSVVCLCAGCAVCVYMILQV